jgi:hypothetical protein
MHICKVTDYLSTEKKVGSNCIHHIARTKCLPTTLLERTVGMIHMQLQLYTYKFCTEILEVILCIYVRLLTIYLQKQKKVRSNCIHQQVIEFHNIQNSQFSNQNNNNVYGVRIS